MTNIISSYHITEYIFYFELKNLHNFFSFIRILILNLFKYKWFLFINFLSTKVCFIDFSYNKVITLIQSPNLVYLFYNTDMCSFVIKKATKAIKALLLVYTTPTLRLSTDKIEVCIAEPDPIKMCVIINKNSFLFKLLYLFLF